MFDHIKENNHYCPKCKSPMRKGTVIVTPTVIRKRIQIY